MDVTYNTMQKKSPLKTILVIILLIACLIGGFLAGAMFRGFHSNEKKLIEGPGYDTSEEAMEAFAQAFASKDIDSMYAACAIESYVNNYDYARFLEMAGNYIPTQRYVAGTDDTGYNLNVAIRESNLTDSFYKIYMAAGLDMDSPLLNGNPISTRDTDVDEIMDQLQFIEAIESIEVEEIGSPMKYIGNTDNFKKNVRENEKIFGGGIKCLVAELDIDGEDYLLFADLIKYEDKWYVLRTNGFAGMFIGLTATSGGIVPVSALE